MVNRGEKKVRVHMNVVPRQPRPQANSRYPSNRRRLGTERDSVLVEFSQQVLRLTSRQNSPGTTGDEAGAA